MIKKWLLISSLMTTTVFADAATSVKKDNVFLGIEGGSATIQDSTEFFGLKVGQYMYEDNKYKVNNRYYLSVARISNEDSVKFYTAKLSLDWIHTQSTIKPFAGVSVGYLYYKSNSVDNSTASYGFQAGVMTDIHEKIELEFSAAYEKATDKKDAWDKSLRKIYTGFTYVF